MRSQLRFFGATAVLLAVAACSDVSTTPTTPAAKSFSPQRSSFDYSQTGRSFGTQSSDFTVTAKGGTFSIGGLYTVTFPANSVCDPSRSSYGWSEWDNPCTTLAGNQSVTVHAALSLSGVGLGIDFSPALRFSPSTQVTISTDVFAPVIRGGQDYFASHPEALNYLAIYYAPASYLPNIPDFVTDPSVITHVDLTTGRVWRRVKHFSGYNQTAGTSCDPSPSSPDCVKIDDTKTP